MPGIFPGRVAYASVSYPAPGAPVIVAQSGDFSAVAGAGGIVQLDFHPDAQIDPTEGFACGIIRNNAGMISVRGWNDTAINLRTTQAGGADAELAFDIIILVRPTV